MKNGLILGFLALFVLAVLPVRGYEFVDVSGQDPYRAAIDYLSDEGIIEGQGESGRFDPDGPLNRAEWAVILDRAVGEEPSADEYGFCFPDVTDEWYAAAVCFAQHKGWMKGYQAGPDEGLFVPVNGLNVAEILVTLQRQQSWPVVDGDQWYTGALLYAQVTNLVDPSWTFDHHLTRAEAIEVLFRTIAVEQLKVQRYDPLLVDLMVPSGPPPSVTPPNSSSPPHVTLRPFTDMPTALTNLPRGAQYVPVLRFTLSTDQPVTLTQLSIKLVSAGYSSNLSKGRLLVDGQIRKDNPFSVDTSVVKFSDLRIGLIPGQEVLMELNVDFVKDAAANLLYQFEVDPGQMVLLEKEALVDGAAVKGNSLRTSGIIADTVTIKNPSSKLNIPFIQTEGAVIGKFMIKAGQHDVLLRRIKLTDSANLDSRNFSNFQLTAGSEAISSIPTVSRHGLDFMINDYLIEAGRERSFTVLADIDEPSINLNVRLALSGASDLYAYDIEFGYGTRVDNQFGNTTAWCLGANTVTCPKPGLRKHCSREDVENRVTDCF
jgi:hypothetical protein